MNFEVVFILKTGSRSLPYATEALALIPVADFTIFENAANTAKPSISHFAGVSRVRYN